ncbi:hypothetical protein PLESTB_001699300 [Pleodorina starrii]|uniref:Uncharacterized protein n=1 Tax=Pleodorina starrii TaxID=330485 RepID=A0A9W6BZZ5_9CHLO|nr:hypothetical protein PLESTB_001699300 [Pleodorina starrii]
MFSGASLPPNFFSGRVGGSTAGAQAQSLGFGATVFPFVGVPASAGAFCFPPLSPLQAPFSASGWPGIAVGASPLLSPALGANFGPLAPPSSAPLAGLSPGLAGFISAPGPLLPGLLPAVPPVQPIGASAFSPPNPGFSAGLPPLGPAGQGVPPLGVASGRLARISGRLQAPPPAPRGEQDTVYQQGLAAVNQVLLGALSGKTVDRQDASTAEFLDWLARCGRGRSWADCTPDDVLVYMVTWWLPHHRGRDGGEVGPSAVKGCLSALSGFFARAGRTGPYNAHTGQGNPLDCVWVEDFRAAYQRTRVLAGVSEVSAVPMTYAKYRALVAQLWGAVAQAPCSLERIVLLRDLLCVLLLWQTAFRGHDIGKLGLGDFVDPAQPDRPYTGFPLPPPWLWGSEAAPTLGFRQRGTKTYKLARAPLVLLEPNSAEPALCIPRTLAHYVWCCSQPDAPAGSAVVDLLFRPLAADKRSFKDTALTSASLAARVRLHLEAAGLHDQEAVHSFRRGALQAAEAAGGEVPTLLGLGQLRSLATLSRYLDRHRHERDVRPRS